MARDADVQSSRLRTAFALHRFGVAMMRQNLRRRHPEATDAQLDDLLKAWMRDRPGAENGDAPGRVLVHPRE